MIKKNHWPVQYWQQWLTRNILTLDSHAHSKWDSHNILFILPCLSFSSKEIKFLFILSFKNGFQAGRERDPFERIFTESPLALFGKSEIGLNARLLNTLTNNKWPLGVDPCGHYFVILNVSINKKLFSLSPSSATDTPVFDVISTF